MQNKDDLRNMVQKLRDKTGYGMMECKKALIKYDYDMEKAECWLKIKDNAVAWYRTDEKGNRISVPKEI
jgi:translation elongation factor EF-Ts